MAEFGQAHKVLDDPETFGQHLIASTLTGPLIEKGRGASVWDESGKKYIDLEAGPGVLSVGHCHPRVVEAIKSQAERLTHAPGHNFTRLMVIVAKRLSDLTQGRLGRVFFANSGAESNDGAIKIALKYNVRKRKQGTSIIALEHGFHGRTSLALSLTGMSERKKGMGPYASFPGVAHMPAPYCYRCPLGLRYPSCSVRCADEIEPALKTKVQGEAAIMIGEPVLGVGGVIVPPKEYWPKVRAILRRYDITLIHDEVFTGFGRTGKMFAHEHWDSAPDMVTFAKAIGGGVPLAGYLATEEIAASLDPGDHYTTFGSNNQVGLSAANAVLDVLNEERLPEKAEELGQFALAALQDVAQRHEVIGEVRGLGLMIGVELVKDREARTPAPELAKRVRDELAKKGFLVAVTGVHGCVVRLTPPLVITRDELTQAIEALDAAVGYVVQHAPR